MDSWVWFCFQTDAFLKRMEDKLKPVNRSVGVIGVAIYLETHISLYPMKLSQTKIEIFLPLNFIEWKGFAAAS